jgi:hypothetical protein
MHPIAFWRGFSGQPHLPLIVFFGAQKTVLKKPEKPLFTVSIPFNAHIESGHFAGFSGNARIGKPGLLCGFWKGYCFFVFLQLYQYGRSTPTKYLDCNP